MCFSNWISLPLLLQVLMSVGLVLGASSVVNDTEQLKEIESQFKGGLQAFYANVSRLNRQLADKDNIDTDGPYGYLPKVVHGVNKIVKGLLKGSVHEVMYGAFSIAPEDVADDILETYNQIFGIPDPDDLNLTEEKIKRRKPAKSKNKAAANNSTTSSTGGEKATKAKPEVQDDTSEEEDEEEDDIDVYFVR